MKRQPTDWEKIFANDVTHKGLTSKLYKPNQKMGRRPTKTFLQRRHTDGQEAHEKMLKITNYHKNANQNYNEVSPHTGQNGPHQKVYK